MEVLKENHKRILSLLSNSEDFLTMAQNAEATHNLIFVNMHLLNTCKGGM